MALNKSKYKNAALYFMKYCSSRHLGLTKLNKLFYYLDFINYRDRKSSVTGDIYIHNLYGPTASNLDSILSEMARDKEIEIVKNPFKDSHTTSFTVRRDPDESVFAGEEKELLRSVCEEFLDWSTDKIIEQTHLEAPWFYSKPLEEVDYNYSSDIEFFNND